MNGATITVEEKNAISLRKNTEIVLYGNNTINVKDNNSAIWAGSDSDYLTITGPGSLTVNCQGRKTSLLYLPNTILNIVNAGSVNFEFEDLIYTGGAPAYEAKTVNIENSTVTMKIMGIEAGTLHGDIFGQADSLTVKNGTLNVRSSNWFSISGSAEFIDSDISIDGTLDIESYSGEIPDKSNFNLRSLKSNFHAGGVSQGPKAALDFYCKDGEVSIGNLVFNVSSFSAAGTANVRADCRMNIVPKNKDGLPVPTVFAMYDDSIVEVNGLRGSGMALMNGLKFISHEPVEKEGANALLFTAADETNPDAEDLLVLENMKIKTPVGGKIVSLSNGENIETTIYRSDAEIPAYDELTGFDPFETTAVAYVEITRWCKLTCISAGDEVYKVLGGFYDDPNGLDAVEAPVREGYDFTGWFEDQDQSLPFAATKFEAAEETIYAGWKKIEEPEEPAKEPEAEKTPETTIKHEPAAEGVSTGVGGLSAAVTGLTTSLAGAAALLRRRRNNR